MFQFSISQYTSTLVVYFVPPYVHSRCEWVTKWKTSWMDLQYHFSMEYERYLLCYFKMTFYSFDMCDSDLLGALSLNGFELQIGPSAKGLVFELIYKPGQFNGSPREISTCLIFVIMSQVEFTQCLEFYDNLLVFSVMLGSES